MKRSETALSQGADHEHFEGCNTENAHMVEAIASHVEKAMASRNVRNICGDHDLQNDRFCDYRNWGCEHMTRQAKMQRGNHYLTGAQGFRRLEAPLFSFDFESCPVILRSGAPCAVVRRSTVSRALSPPVATPQPSRTGRDVLANLPPRAFYYSALSSLEDQYDRVLHL